MNIALSGPSQAFLLNAFDQVRMTPMGIHFGMHLPQGHVASAPLSAHRDQAVYFCDEMFQAARGLVDPSDRILVPLETADIPVDLVRRFYLNAFQIEGRTTAHENIQQNILGAGQYYRFSSDKLLGIGRNIHLVMQKRNGSAQSLGVASSYHSRGIQVYQRQQVGLSRTARELDWLEMGVRFAYSGYLAAAIGSPSKMPLDIALDLAARICLGDDPSFREGFVLSVLGDMSSSMPPIKAMYQLNFRSMHDPVFQDMKGDLLERTNLGPETSFLISSKVVMGRGQHRPALSIGWGRDGFQVVQVKGLNGPFDFTTTSNLFAAAEKGIDEELSEIDRLPDREKVGNLAEHHAELTHAERFLA